MTQLRLRHASACATWLIHMCGVPYSNVQHASFKCATWLITWLIGRWHYQTQVCCSVLQCVAVCCSMLQGVTWLITWLIGRWQYQTQVCYSVLQCVAVCCRVWHDSSHDSLAGDIVRHQKGATARVGVSFVGATWHQVCYCMLQYIAVCCSVLQCVL